MEFVIIGRPIKNLPKSQRRYTKDLMPRLPKLLALVLLSATAPVLLGIQSVAWPDRGIAGITPSSALGDLIQSILQKSTLHLDFYRGSTP